MLRTVSPDSDPFGGINNPYKRNFELLPSEIPFKHPGVKGPPERRTLDEPPIKASVGADRRKSNSQVCYTRITPLDSHLIAGKAEGCVFVSRSKTMFTGQDTQKRSVVLALDGVNDRLSKENSAKLPSVHNPLDDWRLVEELREWTLDGVLLGLDNEVNSSSVLNVAIAGTCPVRNVFDSENVFTLDVCYLALVATLKDATMPSEHYTFQYVPCTSRSFSEPNIYGTVLSRKRPSMSEEQRRNCVGCWKIGRITDTSAVSTKDQHTLTVDVRVEWVGWRALKEFYHDADLAEDLLYAAGSPPFNPCVLFNWPTLVDTNALEAPSRPPMSKDELKLNQEAIQSEIDRGCTVVPTSTPSGTPTGTPSSSPSSSPKKRKRADEDVLESPPSSPIREESKEYAQKQAESILNQIQPNMSEIIAYLSKDARDSVDPVWFSDLQSMIAEFSIQNSDLIRKVEMGRETTDEILETIRISEAINSFLFRTRDSSEDDALLERE